MIFYRNLSGRQLRDRRDEIEAIRQAKGTKVAGFCDFELIELVFDKPAKSPVKRHGFQDTDFTHDTEGQVLVNHRLAGSGTLRFEPNQYGNPTGYLAKTEHNMMMLVRGYADKDYRFMDSAIEAEVKKEFDKYWKTVPEKEKKELALRKQRASMTRFDAPPEPAQTGAPKTDYTEDRVLQQLADAKAEIERLRAELGGDRKPVVPEAPPAPEPPKEEVKESAFPVVTAKDGTVYDFGPMLLFDIRKIAKKYGVGFGLTTEKATLVPAILEAIEKEKVGEPVA